MQLPLQITFRNMETSAAVETRIRQEVAKLEDFYDRIMGCRVAVETPRHHLQRGKIFNIRIDLTVPGGEIVVRHEPSLHRTAKHTEVERTKKSLEVAAAYKDIYVAIRDAFKSARRQLQDFARKQSGVVKYHEPTPHARVSKISLEDGYGFIESLEGEEIYFHEHSVLDGAFPQLTVGTEVSFVGERGDKGPQASTVRIIGKRRRAAPE
jgi:cold shock CspA family protein/ribosome-associated translation inhibitor RaiA